MKRLALTLALVAALFTSGCSYMFVDGPRTPTRPGNCTDGKAWVVVDYALVALHGLWGLAWMSANAEAEQDPNLEAPGNGPVVINVGWMIVHALSGMSGSSKVERCRAAYAAEYEREYER